jgi:hypothetical protein
VRAKYTADYLKKSSAVLRIAGYTIEPDPVYVLAGALVERMNLFGISIAQAQRGRPQATCPDYWAPSLVGANLRAQEAARFLLNELAGPSDYHCPFCKSVYLLEGDGEGRCLVCDRRFIIDRSES